MGDLYRHRDRRVARGVLKGREINGRVILEYIDSSCARRGGGLMDRRFGV